jgi:hypothetical protein
MKEPQVAAKRQSPGIGHNGGLPEHNDIRTALAVEMIFAEQEKALREKKKRARKRMESQGIILSDLSDLKAMEGMTASEIEQLFRRRWHLAGAIHADKYEQLDIFAPKPSAPAARAAHYTMGLLAGLKGEALEIPPLVVGDDQQQMIDGHNEGRERRKLAEESLLNEALAPANDGKVIDGTAGAVNERAAKDFAKDVGDDPLVVNGERYPNMRQANAARKRLEAAGGEQASPESEAPLWAEFPRDAADWSDEQKDAFCTWFDAQPEDATPIEIEHPGAISEFRRLRDAHFETKPDDAKGSPEVELPPAGDSPAEVGTGQPVAPKVVARPDFHSWSENWEEWTGLQTMEFRRWFESLPANTVPAITHEGAVAYYRLLKEERENRNLAGPSEAPEPPDENDVKAGAQKLQESGFVPPKAARKPRNLAK